MFAEAIVMTESLTTCEYCESRFGLHSPTSLSHLIWMFKVLVVEPSRICIILIVWRRDTKPVSWKLSLYRFFPIIGQFKISEIATMSFLLNQVWGRCVKVGGLMGRPDLLFVFDADEIEKVRKLINESSRVAWLFFNLHKAAFEKKFRRKLIQLFCLT